MVIKLLYEGAFSTTLESGLRVLVEEVPSSRSVSVGLWVKVGSRDDRDCFPGLAHFLEHLLFKGTTTRDAARIAEEIDAIGGHLNGGTGKEATVYYADVPADGLPIALDVLADLVQHPAFDSQELDRERGVVLEEIRGRDDDPEQCAYDLFTAGLWKDAHPLSRPVLGEQRTIREVSRETLAEHHRCFYRPENMFLVACGAVDATRLMEATDRLFDGSRPSPPVPARIPPQMRTGHTLHQRDTRQSHLYLGLPGTDARDKDRFTLDVTNTVLGDGMSSRLFRLIREERGLAYAVSSSVTRYSDAGSWIIYAGIAPENVDEVMKITFGELTRLMQEGITSTELSLAKAKLRGNLILNLETNTNRMSRLGSAAITGREVLSSDELIERLDAISSEDIARVIARFTRPDEANLAIIGQSSRGIVGT